MGDGEYFELGAEGESLEELTACRYVHPTNGQFHQPVGQETNQGIAAAGDQVPGVDEELGQEVRRDAGAGETVLQPHQDLMDNPFDFNPRRGTATGWSPP
jgi:hypothetical protein